MEKTFKQLSGSVEFLNLSKYYISQFAESALSLEEATKRMEELSVAVIGD